MHATKDDPALRSPETRAAIGGSIQAHLSARRVHITHCRCTLCSFAGCSPASRCGHCRSLDAVFSPTACGCRVSSKSPAVLQDAAPDCPFCDGGGILLRSTPKPAEPSLDALKFKYATVRELCGLIRDFSKMVTIHAEMLAALGQTENASTIRAAVAKTLAIVGDE